MTISSISSVYIDIFSDFVVPNLNLSKCMMLTMVSKHYNNEQNNFICRVVKEDQILTSYAKDCNLNLFQTLRDSDFSLQTFCESYNSNDMSASIKTEGTLRTEQTNIEATFKIFQLFQSLVVNSKTKLDVITKKLIHYFQTLYKIRNKSVIKSDSEYMLGFKLLDEISWEKSNVNLYNVFENIILLQECKRPYTFKENTSKLYDCTLFGNSNNYNFTLSLLSTIANKNVSMIAKLYSIYCIYKFINILFCLEEKIHIVHSDMFIDKWNKYIIKVYRYIWPNRLYSRYSRYFKNLLIKELGTFSEMSVKMKGM